jgi:hypothetical protein
MSDKKPRLTKQEQRKRVREKARDLNQKAMQNAAGDDARVDAMIKKSIRDHGA